MIIVKRKDDENSQKTVSTFLRRSKKANTVSRLRRSKHHTKQGTNKKKRLAKEKKMRMLKWAEENKYNSNLPY